jgi:tape measure domain-containing protein
MEMETTKAKFEVLLGSAERAKLMIAEISKFANETPYGSEELQKSAETMLGFGISADKIMPSLKMLGDIAMGDKQKLQSLTLAFSQASSAGKLMGQDLLQMINAGFNPLNEMSKQTGKSIAQLKDEMSKGLISAQMLEDAFRGATSAGGQFYGMMDKIGDTASGKLAVLLGDLKAKLTAMAESLLPTVNVVLDAGIKLVANFENIVAVVGTLLSPIKWLATGLFTMVKYFKENKAVAVAFTAGLVALKVATIQATLASKGWTIATKLQYYWLLLVEKAQKLLNLAMYKNPILAVVGVISLLVGALASLRKKTKEAADEFEGMKSTMSSYYAQEKTGLDQMFAKLSQTNPKSKERNELVDELKRMYPDLNSELENEVRNTNDLNNAYDVLLAKMQERARLKGLESISEQHNTNYAMTELAIGEYAKANNLSREDIAGKLRGIYATYKGVGLNRKVNPAEMALLDALGLSDTFAGYEDLELVKNYLKSYDTANRALAQIVSGGESANAEGGITPTTPTTEPGSPTGVAALAASGRREQNINITFRNLIENYNMKATTVKEGITELENELVEGLLRVVNSANRIATQ